MNSMIFGLFFVMVYSQIVIYSTDGMYVKFWETWRAESTTFAPPAGHNFFDWVSQILGPKPTTESVPEITKPDACPLCKCGLTNTRLRIVGGIETKVIQYPWMAQLLSNGKFYCAGSIISDRYVLTASHCVQNPNTNRISVRVGDHDRSTTTETITRDYKVESIIRHAYFSTSRLDNDIALIKLDGVIPFQGLTRPVCLAEKGLAFDGKTGIVTGWGATKESGSTSNKLLEVRVPILTNTKCRSMRYAPERISDNMMCAGYEDGGKDSCQGDSGGPMHVIDETNKTHHVVGIVSWGEGCGRPNFPGVYTRVNRYLTWIKSHTSDACYCQ